MDDPDQALRGLEKASQRLRAADAKAAELREEVYRQMLAARAAGVSLSAMGRALGISRQRVQRIMQQIDR